VLLHYLVVPGLGDGTRSRPEAAGAGAGRVAPFDCGDREDVAVPAVPAEAGDSSPAAEAAHAA